MSDLFEAVASVVAFVTMTVMILGAILLSLIQYALVVVVLYLAAFALYILVTANEFGSTPLPGADIVTSLL